MQTIKLHGKLRTAQRAIIRKHLYEIQGGKCYWCGKLVLCWHPKVSKGGTSKLYMEIDHVIPRCAGGSNTKTNLVGSCGRCNRARGTLFMKFFKRFVIIDQESPVELMRRYSCYSSTTKMEKGISNGKES